MNTYYDCEGKYIDPQFRENYCGQTRVHKHFPCLDCDLRIDLKERGVEG